MTVVFFTLHDPLVSSSSLSSVLHFSRNPAGFQNSRILEIPSPSASHASLYSHTKTCKLKPTQPNPPRSRSRSRGKIKKRAYQSPEYPSNSSFTKPTTYLSISTYLHFRVFLFAHRAVQTSLHILYLSYKRAF
jgi:hypothetical protein